MKKSITIIVLILHACLCAAQYTIESPNQSVKVSLQTNRNRKGASKYLVPTKMTMRVTCEGETVLNKEIGLTVKFNGDRYAFGKANIVHTNKAMNNMDHPETCDSMLTNLAGRYNSLILGANNGVFLEIRAYNNGVAYRFRVTGYPEDYKILEVCNVFPGENPIAILGTYEGDVTLPWSAMKVDVSMVDDEPEITTTTTSTRKESNLRKISWRDALSSVSIGFSADWHSGDTWRDFSDSQGIHADFTYKNIYGGVNYTRCHEIQYIVYEEDYWPFEGLRGSIHAWKAGIKGGYSINMQKGYNIWNFIPYVGTSLMHLLQHGQPRKGAKTLDKHNHYMVGPGFKVQCAFRERISIGAACEYQFFTDKKAPTGMGSFILSIGKSF